MQREFILNTFLLIFLNLLVKPIYILGVELRVQNELGTEAWGLYFTLIGFIYFFQFINDFGFSHFIRKYITEQRDHIKEIFPGLLTTKLVFSIAFITLVWLANLIFGFEQNHVDLLIIITINFTLSTFIQVYRAALAGMGHYRLDSFLSSFDKGLLILIILYALNHFGQDFTIYHFVIGQGISLVLTLAVAILYFYRRHPMPLIDLKLATLNKYIRRSLPFAVIILLMSIYSRLDSVMLRELLADGLYQAGSYGAAFRLYDAANMFVLIIGALLLPMSAHLIKDKIKMNVMINQAVKIVLVITVGCSVVCGFYHAEIMEALYLDYQRDWGQIFLWLMIGFIPLGFGHVFGVLLMANEKVWSLNRIYLGALILNLILNFYLIPEYKAVGAAFATVITQFIVIIAEVILFSRGYKWKMETPFRLLIFVVGSFGIGYAISNFIELNWIISIIVTASSLSIWAVLSGLVPIRELWLDYKANR